MSRNFVLPSNPADPIMTSAVIRGLQGSSLTQHIVLRLVHAWLSDEFIPRTGPEFFYTLWMDREENLIEGVTRESDIAFAQNCLSVQTLYNIQAVTLTKAKRTGRAAPGEIRLHISPEIKFTKIDEIQFREKFPIDSFKEIEFEDLSHLVTQTTHLADLTGRLVSVSEPLEQNTGSVLITAIIENTRNVTATIDYTSNSDHLYRYCDTMELSHPVLITFTSIAITEPEPDNRLLLRSTPGTRLLYGSYTHRYRTMMESFFHDHLPIRVLQDNPIAPTELFRKDIPPTVTFNNLLCFLQSDQTSRQMRYWCLARVDYIINNGGVVIHNDTGIWYEALVSCKDFTSKQTIKFDHTAMVQLLRIPAKEFAERQDYEQHGILKAAENKYFTLELAVYRDDNNEKKLLVTTLWSPLCSHIS
ncbi:unnamed protein product [Linum trigynum]|uniref:Uncharacterized protein n=1 Tax=Linum trigynum TaxID=586398 RepID=A0AAV2FG15_9ROSI